MKIFYVYYTYVFCTSNYIETIKVYPENWNELVSVPQNLNGDNLLALTIPSAKGRETNSGELTG